VKRTEQASKGTERPAKVRDCRTKKKSQDWLQEASMQNRTRSKTATTRNLRPLKHTRMSKKKSLHADLTVEIDQKRCHKIPKT